MNNEYSENAKKIYEKLYLQEGETIEDCHHRVANFLADGSEYSKFKKLLDNQTFRINTPCMSNAGVKKDPNLMACYILDLDDNMSSIIDMWGTCARIYEGGGGAGIPITNLREEGAPISSGGEASGPLSYMEVIQSISDQVKSGGRNRRAANLISYWYNHPDAPKITNCKRDKKSFQAMNLSMLVNNDFMQRINDKGSKLPNDPSGNPYFHPQQLWDQVIQSAWETGDPGLLFYDRINQDNPFPNQSDIVCSNPCGEVVGMPWTSCVLGHINLNKMLDGDCIFDNDKFIDTIYWGVLMLNRIIEKTAYPNEEFRKTMLKTKPIGLGIMGVADILYKIKIGYNTEKAKHFIQSITQRLTQNAFNSSIELVEGNKIKPIQISEDRSAFRKYLRGYYTNPDCIDKIGNSMVTCIAPTGSTSISADCSYGFEPHFGLAWKKMLDEGGTMNFLNDDFLNALYNTSGVHKDMYSQDKLIELINKNNGSIQNIEGIPQQLKDIFVTAHDINWKDRIDMQAAAQEWITMSISSTVNLPNKATREDIEEVYKYAWQQGLKGITVFRDGCLGDNQPIDFGRKDQEDQKNQKENKEQKMIEGRPQVRSGKTVEIKTPDGKLYLTGNYWRDGQLKEVFMSMSNQDSRTNHLLNSIGRILSRALQYDVPLGALLDTMRGGGGEVFFLKLNDDPSIRVSGVVDGAAHIIDKEFRPSNKEISDDEEIITDEWIERCPSCGSYSWRRSGSCRGGYCTNCGESNCL